MNEKADNTEKDTNQEIMNELELESKELMNLIEDEKNIYF